MSGRASRAVDPTNINDDAPDALHVDADNPWPGLWPFTEGSENFFNGRAQATSDLARLVRRETLTVLQGQSGLGKSSLLMAGLFPLMRREEYLPVYLRLDHSDGSPPFDEQILNAIFAECDKVGVEAPVRPAGTGLWEYLHLDGATFWGARTRAVIPLLVIDQFEELFTVGRTNERRKQRSKQFEHELAELVDNRAPDALLERMRVNPDVTSEYDLDGTHYKIVIGIREDYVANLDGLKRQMRLNLHNFLRLLPMDEAQALEAVLKTGGSLIDHAAAVAIVRFLSTSASTGAQESTRELQEGEVDPAILSMVCRELNEKRRRLGRPQITADLLEDKSQKEILEEFYDRSFKGLDPRVRKFVEDELLTESGFRSSAAVDDARKEGITREDIELLVRRRLLRTEVRSRVLRIELTHDVLTEVVRESRDRRRIEEEQEQQRRALEQREIEASKRAEEEARRTAQARRVTQVVSVAAVILLAIAAWGWTQTRKAQTAAQQASIAAQQELASVVMAKRADSARLSMAAHADTIQVQSDSMLREKNQKLQRTVDSLKAAQLAVLVSTEAADHYLRMSGEIVRHRQALDSAFNSSAQRVVNNAAAIRAEAKQNLTLIAAALCPPTSGAREDSSSIRLRADIDRRLASAKLVNVLDCASSAGTGLSQPSP